MTHRSTNYPGRPTLTDLVATVMLGIGIALSLSALMLVAAMQGVSRLPMPLAVAFAAHLFGKAALGSALVPVGLLLHVGYLTATALLPHILFRRPLGAVAAFGTAAVLWVIAGLTIVPYVGWGVFGTGLGAGAALNVLLVHLGFAVFLWVGSWLLFRTHDGASALSTASLRPGRTRQQR